MTNKNHTATEKTVVLSQPTPTEAANAIINGLEGDKTIHLLCSCDAEYGGRAGSYLPEGNRTITIKPDGNFLVTGATKHKPRNWQPTGAECSVEIENETLVLESIRRRPKEEELIVYCNPIYTLIVYDSGEDPDVVVEGTEEDIHQHILDNPESHIEPGFTPVEHEKEVEWGAIDIYGYDKTETPVVVEVKRRRASLKHVDQLDRYVTAINQNDTEARGILVAPSIGENAEHRLQQKDFEFVEFDPTQLLTG